MQLDQHDTITMPDGRRIQTRAKPCDQHRCFQWQAGARVGCGFKTPEAALQDARDVITSAG